MLGPLHGRRVRADRAPPHARLRHAARGARRGRGDDPQPRRAQPEAVFYGRRVTPRGRARVAHGRRSVPPARLRDQLRGRRRPRAHDRRARRATSASTPIYLLGGAIERQGMAYVTAPVWDRYGWSRAPRRAARVRAVRPRPGRRRRVRALRPVLVRADPPARGLRLLQGGRGRRLRDGRPHRDRRRVPARRPTAGCSRSATPGTAQLLQKVTSSVLQLQRACPASSRCATPRWR